ncbi:MAG: pantetheine-phosphate adenylyltransferase [Ruminococcaceae bacterium]|nr:pantetheine-phosphate adenylyltransferase [Oscillospiraceae bacterium]
MKIAVYPGSFDPVTMGHMDIIRRGAQMFDKLVVSVLINTNKKSLFTMEERVELLKKSVEGAGLTNVEVSSFSGLLADYTEQIGACTIVRGLRAVTDFENEFQLALINRKLNPNADTVFLVTSAENMYLSSSLVREVGSFGGDISEFVPPEVIGQVTARLVNKAE